MTTLSLFAIKPPVPCTLGATFALACAGCGAENIAGLLADDDATAENIIMSGHNDAPFKDNALRLSPAHLRFLPGATAKNRVVAAFCVGCSQKIRQGVPLDRVVAAA